jgi:hypothetical protein
LKARRDPQRRSVLLVETRLIGCAQQFEQIHRDRRPHDHVVTRGIDREATLDDDGRVGRRCSRRNHRQAAHHTMSMQTAIV